MRTPFHKAASCLALLGLTMTAPVVFADDLLAQDNATSVPSEPSNAMFRALRGWQVIAGGGVMLRPKYEGGDEYEVSPIPFVSAQFGDYVTVNPRGVGYKALNYGPFSFEMSLGYQSGRDEDDGDALRGMGDIDWGVTVGGKATAEFGPVGLFVSVEKILGGSDGLLAEAGIEVQQPISNSVILGAEAVATFADDNYMESYFGVSALQSARSGHARYNAEAGLKSAGVGVSATWLMTEHWLLRGEQRIEFLTGDAADSPVVVDEVQSRTMLMLGYRF